MDNFAAIANLLFCPDDGASLQYFSGQFQCNHCGRCFPLREEDLLEILPRSPRELPRSVASSYREAYLSAFKETYYGGGLAFAWGAEETVSKSWACKRQRQVAMVRRIITEGCTPSETVFCDISAGAGYYTFSYARCFRLVFHCDLSVQNLSYSRRKARSLGIQNIFFLRADYFALPFQQSLDRILCTDTLIRGEEHDRALLALIARSLRPSGCAVIDLHNWWHNPLRRLGILPENFSQNRSYSRREARMLLKMAGVHRHEAFLFHQEFESGHIEWSALARFLPATRFLLRFDGSSYSQSAAPRSSSLSLACPQDGATFAADRITNEAAIGDKR